MDVTRYGYRFGRFWAPFPGASDTFKRNFGTDTRHTGWNVMGWRSLHSVWMRIELADLLELCDRHLDTLPYVEPESTVVDDHLTLAD